MHELHIGGESVEFFALTIHGRQDPDNSDYWDGNWLTCHVEVAAGAFRGALDAMIRIEDLDRFLQEARPLYNQLYGQAKLEAMEGWLSLDVVGDGRGHIQMNGRISDERNTLDFHLALDQTDLKALIARLEEVCRAYPIVGR